MKISFVCLLLGCFTIVLTTLNHVQELLLSLCFGRAIVMTEISDSVISARDAFEYSTIKNHFLCWQ